MRRPPVSPAMRQDLAAAPLAAKDAACQIVRAMRAVAIGDVRTVRLPAGEEKSEMLAIECPVGD